MKKAILLSLALASLPLLITGCANKETEKKAEQTERPATLITVAKVQKSMLQVTEKSLGRIETAAKPKVAAEVAGQVVRLHVDVGRSVKKGDLLAQIDDTAYQNELRASSAEVRRVQAQLENQERQVKRLQDLSKQNFVSKTQLDDAEAQKRVLTQQLEGVSARLAIVQRNLDKTRVFAPVAGEVQRRLVSPGDFVAPGAPLFELTTHQKLQIVLPFPEKTASRLKPGLEVKLSLNVEEGGVQAHGELVGVVTEVRPDIATQNLSADVIVEVDNPGDWRPGASVDGVLVLEERQALMVSDLAVVQRPAGTVVYVIKDGVAEQRQVTTGVWQKGRIEIRTGIEEGDTVAEEGAYYLTNGAKVRIKESKP